MPNPTQTHHGDPRVAVLEACRILDTPPEEEFDFIARLAAETCGVPMAVVSLIDGDRQWFKASVGLGIMDVPSEDSLCQHVVVARAPLVSEDASADPRFSDSPLVCGPPDIRLYAGAPIVTHEGYVLGTVCVADTEPGPLSPTQLERLEGLARQAAALLDRRRHENELNEALRRLERGERLARVGTWEWRRDLDEATTSPAYDEILGVPEGSNLSYEQTLERVHPDDRERVHAEVRKGMKTADGFESEARVVRPDGEVRRVHTRAEIVRDQSGAIQLVRGATQDVTEQRRAAQDLRVRGQILDEVEAGIFTLNSERRITYWNHGAERLYGWTRDEAVGRRGSELKLISLRSLSAANEARDRTLGGEKWEGTLELLHKRGRTIQVLAALSPVRDATGEVSGVVAVTVDVSERKRHEDELARSREETIYRLARAMETRDRDTGGHIERIGEWAAMIGERLGLSSQQVERLRIASPMHDVGKIGISDNVLRKPGALTPEERAEMERHVDIGHRILAGSGVPLLDLAAEIALTHHEWFDGTGYPRGLRGHEIPLSGRIVAVADVFDALTSDRVYRRAMPVDTAIDLMRSERETHFDPDVLDVLLNDLPAFIAEQRRTNGSHLHA